MLRSAAPAGIPAHTLSCFAMHSDHPTPDVEVDRVDFAQLTAVVDAAVQSVRSLADGPRPTWKDGGRPGLEGR